MTHSSIPPEDAFDRWLDELADSNQPQTEDENAEAAVYLHDHFALATPKAAGPSRKRKAEMRGRIFSPAAPPTQQAPTRSPGSPGIVAGPARVIPIDRHNVPWRIGSIVSAAILVLVALATLGAALRLDDGERAPGVSATASMMPFAPASALASPAAMAGCATDDTLLLMPEEPTDPGAFTTLPFPVAWYQDGTLTVEHRGDVIREIEIGDAHILRPTSVPNVILATEIRSGSINRSERTVFANIATGETFEIAPPDKRIVFTDGPFALWTSDASYTRWQVIDLRTFETADLGTMFAVTPPTPWTPYEMATSDDGTVLMVGTATHHPVNQTVPPATPATHGGPKLQVGRSALLITGSLDDISVVGPIAASSGDVALSPDGQLMAWLAPSDRAGERILTIADTATGRITRERPVEATYSNSVLFNADGTVLYSTSGATLDRIPVHTNAATPGTVTAPITLPDSHYRIMAADPAREHLLLVRTQNAAGENSVWLDVKTGEMRELEGTLGRMFTSGVPAISSTVNAHLQLDDLVSRISILDMATGKIVMTIDRRDGSAMSTISADGGTVLVPREGGVELLDLDTGTGTTHPAPEGTDDIPWTFTVSSNGTCVAGNWSLENGDLETVLLSTSSDTQTPLPTSAVGGWVPGKSDESISSP